MTETDPRGGSRATWDPPASDLPRGPAGGVELCHRCRQYRATEHVHDLNGTPTCQECDPSLAPAPEPEPTPRKRSAGSSRSSSKTARARKATGK